MELLQPCSIFVLTPPRTTAPFSLPSCSGPLCEPSPRQHHMKAFAKGRFVQSSFRLFVENVTPDVVEAPLRAAADPSGRAETGRADKGEGGPDVEARPRPRTKRRKPRPRSTRTRCWTGRAFCGWTSTARSGPSARSAWMRTWWCPRSHGAAIAVAGLLLQCMPCQRGRGLDRSWRQMPPPNRHKHNSDKSDQCKSRYGHANDGQRTGDAREAFTGTLPCGDTLAGASEESALVCLDGSRAGAERVRVTSVISGT